MGEISLEYLSSAMTTTKRTSDKFTVPDGGCTASDLKRTILDRYPDTIMDRVLENCRWIVDGRSIDPSSSYVLKDGDVVHIVPRLVGG
jgi:molybdopterin converting factor small subunit